MSKKDELNQVTDSEDSHRKSDDHCAQTQLSV